MQPGWPAHLFHLHCTADTPIGVAGGELALATGANDLVLFLGRNLRAAFSTLNQSGEREAQMSKDAYASQRTCLPAVGGGVALCRSRQDLASAG